MVSLKNKPPCCVIDFTAILGSSHLCLSRVDDRPLAFSIFGLPAHVDLRCRQQTWQRMCTELQLPCPNELCILASRDDRYHGFSSVRTPSVMGLHLLSGLTSITCPNGSMLRPVSLSCCQLVPPTMASLAATSQFVLNPIRVPIVVPTCVTIRQLALRRLVVTIVVQTFVRTRQLVLNSGGIPHFKTTLHLVLNPICVSNFVTTGQLVLKLTVVPTHRLVLVVLLSFVAT